eukprot:m.22572 g.22572  ORF g.22572 m.22572 type:complete len:320 (+) comp6862_c0_seq1:133-1092(+)
MAGRVFVVAAAVLAGVVGVVVAAPSSASAPSTLSKGPIVGVLAQSSDGASYIAASYIKYLESAGARVVPVPYDASEDTVTSLFHSLNGLLIPGGGQDLKDPKNNFLRIASQFVSLSTKAFDANGEVFPIWGTCLGFETLSVAIGSSAALDGGFDSENLPLPLTLAEAASTSRLLGSAPSKIINALITQNTTMNNHQSGVTPATYASNKALSGFFDVLSTNKDRKGRAFVSTIEAKKYPIFGTQWHPEKNAYEWTANEQIPHSSDAVDVCFYMAQFFVNLTRESSHVMSASDFYEKVIWNYSPKFTGIDGSGFDQEYIFH